MEDNKTTTKNFRMIRKKQSWGILAEMERKREITTYFAQLRSFVIRGAIPNIIASFDKNDNLVDLTYKYPPHIEKALAEINAMEEYALSTEVSVKICKNFW